MKNVKTIACAAMLTLAFSTSSLAKTGTISATQNGTISATRNGTISATRNGTISATRNGTVSPTGIIPTVSGLDSIKIGFFDLFMTALRIW